MYDILDKSLIPKSLEEKRRSETFGSTRKT